MNNSVETVDYWDRRALLDSLSGAPFHEFHDLDTAQFDAPRRKPKPAWPQMRGRRVNCHECGLFLGLVHDSARERLLRGQHWIAEHLT